MKNPTKSRVAPVHRISDPSINRAIQDLSFHIEKLYKKIDIENGIKLVRQPNDVSALWIWENGAGWKTDINSRLVSIGSKSGFAESGPNARMNRSIPIEGEALQYNSTKVIPIKAPAGGSDVTLKNNSGELLVRLDDSRTFGFNGTNTKVVQDNNNGNPTWQLGSSDTECFKLSATYETDAKGFNNIKLDTLTAGSTLNAGKMTFSVDESDRLVLDDGTHDLFVTGATGTNIDADSQYVGLNLINEAGHASNTNTRTNIIFWQQMANVAPVNYDQVAGIVAGSEGTYNTNTSTADGYLALHTALNGALVEQLKIGSDGTSTFTGGVVGNVGMSTKNGSTGPGFVDFYEDSDNGTNKITLLGQASTADITVYLPRAAGTLRTIEATPLVISYPFYFNDTTTGRTYFRDTDDPNDIMSWDGFDAEYSTSVDATATIVAANAVSGVVVPYACTYVGAYFLGYQAQNTAGEGIFQTWTGVPGDGTGSASTTVTLRTTNAISANRASESFATSDVSIILSAGSMVYPAFQYISGTSPIWYGNIALKFENISV